LVSPQRVATKYVGDITLAVTNIAEELVAAPFWSAIAKRIPNDYSSDLAVKLATRAVRFGQDV